jgi:hypothetical protein
VQQIKNMDAKISQRSIHMNIGVFAQQHHRFHGAIAQMCYFTVQYRDGNIFVAVFCILVYHLPKSHPKVQHLYRTTKKQFHADVWVRVLPQTTTIQVVRICNTHCKWTGEKPMLGMHDSTCYAECANRMHLGIIPFCAITAKHICWAFVCFH